MAHVCDVSEALPCVAKTVPFRAEATPHHVNVSATTYRDHMVYRRVTQVEYYAFNSCEGS
jgi:hypothetical protein